MVTPIRRWDYARPITKKRNSISFGTYPEVSLLNARAKELNVENYSPKI